MRSADTRTLFVRQVREETRPKGFRRTIIVYTDIYGCINNYLIQNEIISFKKKDVEVDFLFFSFYGKIVVYRLIGWRKQNHKKKVNHKRRKKEKKTKLEKKEG